VRSLLAGHCAAVGRDISEITCSAVLRYESPQQLRADAEAMAAAGCDLGIVSLPKAAPPSVVEDVAAALL
jgi:hypothetical protein